MHLYITVDYLSNDTKLDFKGPEAILGKESHDKHIERVLCNELASLAEISGLPTGCIVLQYDLCKCPSAEGPKGLWIKI